MNSTAARNVLGVVWDFDGTLVDSRQKNLNVTRKIIETMSSRPADEIAALRSLQDYERVTRKVQNWRQLYLHEYGLTAEQTEVAGKLWTEFQLKDQTPTPLFAGLNHVLRHLHPLPQAVFSQNSMANIAAVLKEAAVDQYFKTIIGYEEVDFHRQKPAPDGLLLCLEALLDGRAGVVLFIGDHQVDAECANRANQALLEAGAEVEVISVGAFYAHNSLWREWETKPRLQAYFPAEILQFINRDGHLAAG